MKVTILGCGPSAGVPLIGCDCAVCTSNLSKNKRSRASIYIDATEQGGPCILIDTSPDLYHQAIRSGIKRIDAVLFTHAHADHLHGIDDLRSFNYYLQAPIPIYADQVTLEEIATRFAYTLREPIPEYGWFRPCVTPNEITAYEAFNIQGLNILPIPGNHGRSISMSYRIGNFTYSTDVNEFSGQAWDALKGTKQWIVDCLRISAAPTHANLETALGWIEDLLPKNAYLTHMSHDFDYQKLSTETPYNVEPAYDGLTIDVS